MVSQEIIKSECKLYGTSVYFIAQRFIDVLILMQAMNIYITVGKQCGAETYNPFLSRFSCQLQSLWKILRPNYFSSTHITVVSIFTIKTNFPNPIIHWEFFVCFCFLTIKENSVDHVFLSSKLFLVVEFLVLDEKGHSEGKLRCLNSFYFFLLYYIFGSYIQSCSYICKYFQVLILIRSRPLKLKDNATIYFYWVNKVP